MKLVFYVNKQDEFIEQSSPRHSLNCFSKKKNLCLPQNPSASIRAIRSAVHAIAKNKSHRNRRRNFRLAIVSQTIIFRITFRLLSFCLVPPSGKRGARDRASR